MATYPKITGNTLSILNRSLDAFDDTVLVEKIISSDNVEEIYALIFISNRGGAGTSLTLNEVNIRDASNTIVTNTNSTTDQEKTFVINPLLKTANNVYTATHPFMGSLSKSGSNFNIETSNQYTHTLSDANLQTVLGNSNSGYAAETNAARFIRLGQDSTGKIVMLKGALDQGGNGTDSTGNSIAVTSIIPVYNSTEITGASNSLSANEYCAVLIKANNKGTGYDGVQNGKFFVSHNGSNSSESGSGPFNINLSVTGANDFIFQLSFNNNTHTSGDNTARIESRMHFVPISNQTGFSQPITSDFFNTVSVESTNDEGGEFTFGGNDAANILAIASQYISSATGGGGAPNFPFDDEDSFYETLFGDYTQIFKSNSISAEDISFLDQALDITINKTAGESIDNSIFNNLKDLFQEFDVPTKLLANDTYNQSIRQSTNSSLVSATYDAEPGVAVYQNFNIDDITKRGKLNYLVQEGGSENNINHDITIPYAVYPLYTYPLSTINAAKADVINISGGFQNTTTAFTANTSGISDKMGDIVHANDSFETFAVATNQTPQVNTSITQSSAESTGSVGIGVVGQIHHNVRINSRNSSDDLSVNGFASTPGVSDYGVGVSAIHATDESTITTTGDTVAADSTSTTKISTSTNKFQDYTIASITDLANTISSEDFNSDVKNETRDTDGTYSSSYNEKGFIRKPHTYKAPVTNVKPGLVNGVAIGTKVIPYFGSVGAPCKELILNSGFYNHRPAFSWGSKDTTSSALQGSSSIQPVEEFNLLAPTGYTATAASPTDGLAILDSSASGDDRYRKVSASAKVVAGSKYIEMVSNGTNFSTIIKSGFQVYLDAFFPAKTKVVQIVNLVGNGTAAATTHSSTTYTPATSHAKAYIELDQGAIDTSASQAIVFGKPTFNYLTRNTSFVHVASSTKATIVERDRINSSYGLDLSYVIEQIKPEVIKSGDNVHVQVITTATEYNSISAADISDKNTVFEANANAAINPTSTNIANVYNFAPVEWGILCSSTNSFGINSQKISRRSMYQGGTFNTTGGSSMIEASVGAGQFDSVTSKFKHTFNLKFFNQGQEDVFIHDVSLFDPYYIPSDSFSVRPANATNTTWATTFSHNINGVSSPVTTGTKFVDSDDVLSSVAGNTVHNGKSLQKRIFSGNTSNTDQSNFIDTINENNIDVLFEVDSTNAAGIYYQALEVRYYRDISVTQNKISSDGTVTVRGFNERPLWRSRILLKINLSSVGQISIEDSDGTSITSSSSIDFGTLTI